MKQKPYSYLITIIFLFLWNVDFAQFYNGHQMTFGKSRIQFQDIYWRYHRHDRFDSYFYYNGKDLSLRVSEIAEKKINEIENFFGYGLQKRLIFLCYRNLSEFRESNVGYSTSDESSNMGGVTRILKNKIFVYYEGEQEKLEKQITAGISRIIINEMMYGGNYRQKLTNSTLINFPEWYIAGLISYLSEGWSIEIENRIKDGFESRKFKKINHLTGEDAKYAGHSFWYFIAETYGHDVIPNILYLTKINKNIDGGFRYVLGSGVKGLSPVWKDFYNERFLPIKDKAEMPNKEKEITKTRKNTVYQQVKISPDNKYIAFTSNIRGKYKVWILDKETGKKKKIRRKGHKLEQITDYSYPVLGWHPSGKILAFFTEEQGEIILFTYFVETEELKRKFIHNFEKVLSFDYSDNGFKMVISAVKNSKSDIFILNTSSSIVKNITDDAADDLNPSFTDNSAKILFSSNRTCDSVNCENNAFSDNYDIFSYNLKEKSNKVEKITNTPYSNEKKIREFGENIYVGITDKNGIFNREIIKYDSTISRIDTAIHYRYFTTNYLVTNYPRNINDFDLNKKNKNVSDIIFYDKKYRIFELPFVTKKEDLKEKSFVTEYRKKTISKKKHADSIAKQKIIDKEKHLAFIDSLRKNPPKDILHPDSNIIDINNYVFEKEKHTRYYEINPIKDTTENKENPKKEDVKAVNNYLTNFYTNHLTQQVDFGMLKNSYQVFTGSAYYFNPGINIFTKIGVFDLFEDYRISGGFRMGTGFDSYEYLFSIENLKQRLDKEYIYHRQTQTEEYRDGFFTYSKKIYTNEFLYILKYPFNQVTSAKATLSLRHDKTVWLSNNYNALMFENSHQFFSGVKLEYIFDNSIGLGMNLYDGTRFKIFGEFYQEIDQEYANFFVVGYDFRFYKKIHRSLIFASRTAASSSFGKSKLIYYLGGVDNWYVFSPDKQMFDYTVNIDQTENYVYQAAATNMRGFIQNTRNGTNFCVINNEIRFPIFRYFANRPLNSSFFNNFQVVGFADIGSAWSGLTPLSDKNEYLNETIQRGPITVVVDKNRKPLVFGYGFGLRSKLLGYFVRVDWAWGIDSDVILPRIFYFSLNLDF